MQVTIEKATDAPAEKKSLYQVNLELAKIVERLESLALNPDDQDGVEVEQLSAMLDINDSDLEATLERYAWVMGEMKARAQFLKERAKAMADMAKAKESVIATLESRIKNALLLRGVSKVETETHTVSLRKSEGVVVTDEKAIPPSYMQTQIVSKPDKTGIKKALKMGQEIPGAFLEERQNVQIK